MFNKDKGVSCKCQHCYCFGGGGFNMFSKCSIESFFGTKKTFNVAFAKHGLINVVFFSLFVDVVYLKLYRVVKY